jgi:hypothetical protein
MGVRFYYPPSVKDDVARKVAEVSPLFASVPATSGVGMGAAPIPWRWAKSDIRYERRLTATMRPVVARPREGRQTRRSAASTTRRTTSKEPSESDPPPRAAAPAGWGEDQSRSDATSPFASVWWHAMHELRTAEEFEQLSSQAGIRAVWLGRWREAA